MGVQERRARERTARKETILDAARALLLERGFTGTTTKQIADRCELSEATVFFYFKSKDEILTSLLFEGIDFWRRGLDKVAALTLTPEETLSRIWKFFAQVHKEHPEYYQLSAFLARPQAISDVSDDVRGEIILRSGENFQQLGALLEDALGQGKGRIAGDLLWASFLGLMLVRESRINLGSPRHPTDRDMSRILKLLTHGLLPEAHDGRK